MLIRLRRSFQLGVHALQIAPRGTCVHRFIEWDFQARTFTVAQSALTLPVHPSRNTWWTSTAEQFDDDASVPVTHFGNRVAADWRARMNIGWNRPPTGLFEVSFTSAMPVLDEIYEENGSNGQMLAFEKRLLESDAVAAYYWNQKESQPPAWSLIVRREYVGQLPKSPGPDVRLVTEMTAGRVTRSAHPWHNQIEWDTADN